MVTVAMVVMMVVMIVVVVVAMVVMMVVVVMVSFLNCQLSSRHGHGRRLPRVSVVVPFVAILNLIPCFLQTQRRRRLGHCCRKQGPRRSQ